MESRIAGGDLGFVHFSNFIYVTYCDLACFRPKIWNSLNDELRTSPTLKTFVTRIRKITFDACNCSLCNC